MIAVCLNKHLDWERHPFILKCIVSLRFPPPPQARLFSITGLGWRWRNHLKPSQCKIIKGMKNDNSLKLHCIKNVILILLPYLCPSSLLKDAIISLIFVGFRRMWTSTSFFF